MGLRLVVLRLALAGLGAGQTNTRPITQSEVTKWILAQQADSYCRADQIYIERLDHFDFKGDGGEEAIVVAATCNTGTAGPDVHSVVARSPKGGLEELEVPDAEKSAYNALFGNLNYDLTIEDGLLVATWHDTSDREDPLVIRYKWNGTRFVILSVEKSKPFRTSYDCSAVEGAGCADPRKQTENAICDVESLANLDLKLDAVYKAYLKTLSAADGERARAEQRKWIEARACTIYKEWVECLTKKYVSRIHELEKRMK